MTERISPDVCKKLYEKYETPEHVVGHCKAVRDTAVGIARALNNHGYNLDIELIQGAALAHDVARVREHHELVGAKILSDLGYNDEAAIVKVHMRYSFNDFEHLNETDLVCLGDRLVKEDKYVGLDERIDYIIHKVGDKPEVTKRILESKAATRIFMKKIEETIGQTIDSLFE